jgi:hypothetical protein
VPSGRYSLNEPQNRSSVSPGSGLRPHSTAARLLYSRIHTRGVTGIDSDGSQVEQGVIPILALAQRFFSPLALSDVSAAA